MRRPGWPTVFFNPGWIGLSHPYVPYKVVRHHLDGQPGGVGGEAPRGETVEPHAVLEVSDGILDLGVAAMVGLQCQGFPVPVRALPYLPNGTAGAPDPPTRLLNRLGGSRQALSDRPLLHAALTISPSNAIVGREHPLCVATAPCTQPNRLEPSPHISFPYLPSLV